MNLNNNILNIVIDPQEEIIEIEKKMFEMNIKNDIIGPPLLDYTMFGEVVGGSCQSQLTLTLIGSSSDLRNGFLYSTTI